MAASPRLVAVAAAAAVVSIVCTHAPASAHTGETANRQVVRIRAVAPAWPTGVVVQVRHSIADQLVAENKTDRPLEVLGDDGRAFLRIGPDGVDADVGSRDFAQTSSPFGTTEGPTDNDGAVRWVRVSAGHAWGWFDHRLHPADAQATQRSGLSVPWMVPFRLGGDDVSVRGDVATLPRQGVYVATLSSTTKFKDRFAIVSGRVPAFSLAMGSPTITVLGREGEPVVRAGTNVLEVNDASPTWALTRVSRGESPNGLVGIDEPPRWRAVRDSVLTWLDDRAALPEAPPADVSRRATTRWSIAIRADGPTVHALTGTIQWTPAVARLSTSPGAPDRTRVLVAGVAFAAFVTWLWWRFGRTRNHIGSRTD